MTCGERLLRMDDALAEYLAKALGDVRGGGDTLGREVKLRERRRELRGLARAG